VEDRPLQERWHFGIKPDRQCTQQPTIIIFICSMTPHPSQFSPRCARRSHPFPWMDVRMGTFVSGRGIRSATGTEIRWLSTPRIQTRTSLAGSSANTHLIERFTRTDADTLLMNSRSTIRTVWTRPMDSSNFRRESEERIYEFACHEGIRPGGSSPERARREGSGRSAKKEAR